MFSKHVKYVLTYCLHFTDELSKVTWVRGRIQRCLTGAGCVMCVYYSINDFGCVVYKHVYKHVT